MVITIFQTSRYKRERGRVEKKGLLALLCLGLQLCSIYLFWYLRDRELKPLVFYTSLYYCLVSFDSQQ